MTHGNRTSPGRTLRQWHCGVVTLIMSRHILMIHLFCSNLVHSPFLKRRSLFSLTPRYLFHSSAWDGGICHGKTCVFAMIFSSHSNAERCKTANSSTITRSFVDSWYLANIFVWTILCPKTAIWLYNYISQPVCEWKISVALLDSGISVVYLGRVRTDGEKHDFQVRFLKACRSSLRLGF